MRPFSIICRIVVISIFVSLMGCQMNQQTQSSSLSSAATAVANPDSVPVLHFKLHSYGGFCFNTYECKVVYAGLAQPNTPPGKLRPSFESVGGEEFLKTMGGSGHINIKNFPTPAKVRWRSKDGTSHSAEIDIGKIFKDERIIHHLPLRDFPHSPETTGRDVTILLIVDDRTIKVYMLSEVNMNYYLTLAYSQTF